MRTQNPLVATPCGFKSHRRHHVGMDCAPFEKPSRKAGLFSYRSVIPPSPHETLLAQISAGAPAARWAAMRGGASLAAVFLQKSPRAHSAAAPSPRETLLAQTFAGAPPPCGRPCGAAYRLRRLFCFTKSSSRAHSAAPPSPHETLLRKVSWGTPPPCGRPCGAVHRLRRLSASCSARFLTEAGGYAMLIHKSYERKA